MTASARRFRGKTAEERKAERKVRLVDAGLTLFGSKGFHGVGVREICAEAQLTERYFYESFANREALFSAVYQHCVDMVRDRTDRALSESAPAPTPGGQLPTLARAGLGAFFHALRDEPRMPRILLIDVLTINPDVSAQSRVAVETFADLVGDLAGVMFPDLRRRGLEPNLIGTGLVGTTVFLAMRWAARGFDDSVETMVEHATLFYEGVARAALERDDPART